MSERERNPADNLCGHPMECEVSSDGVWFCGWCLGETAARQQAYRDAREILRRNYPEPPYADGGSWKAAMNLVSTIFAVNAGEA